MKRASPAKPAVKPRRKPADSRAPKKERLWSVDDLVLLHRADDALRRFRNDPEDQWAFEVAVIAREISEKGALVLYAEQIRMEATATMREFAEAPPPPDALGAKLHAALKAVYGLNTWIEQHTKALLGDDDEDDAEVPVTD